MASIFRFHTELKVMDYYFFGIGVASLMNAFFMLSYLSDFLNFTLLVFFFMSNFCVSILLKSVLVKKLKQIYVWNSEVYLLKHIILTFVVCAATVSTMLFVRNILNFVIYFQMINFFLMIILTIAVLHDSSI